MGHRVVCVSRVTAAGGEAIGKLVAERLGFRYVDDEIIALAAEHAGVDPSVVASAEHHKGLLARLVDALFATRPEPEGYLGPQPREYYASDAPPPTVPPAEELRHLIQDAIAEIAERGRAVIVAHAASMALARRADVLRVHVTASPATRVTRLFLSNMLVTEDEYAKMLAESDQQRRKYLARFYDVHDESPTHYDLVVNTDALDVATAAAAVVALVTA